MGDAGELHVRPDTLRDTARGLHHRADDLVEVRQRLDTTGLTPEDWGTSWATDQAREAYQRTRARLLDSIHSATRDLADTAERLRRSALEYERAEADSTPAGSAGPGAG
ncbi:MAG TPA: type VII secretion target [Mycobacteriales bacterium]|nr:type VII secretion target [Mycobacteriales bacterium]